MLDEVYQRAYMSWGARLGSENMVIVAAICCWSGWRGWNCEVVDNVEVFVRKDLRSDVGCTAFCALLICKERLHVSEANKGYE